MKDILNKLHITLIAATMAALLPLQAAHAMLDIEITQARDGAFPIAVVPFSWSGEQLPADDVAAIIRNDLARSGEFNALAVTNMRQRPTSLAEVDREFWRQEGIESLVIGQVAQKDNGEYQVTVQLLDLFVGDESDADNKEVKQRAIRPVLAKRYLVKEELLRNLAHHLSDLIYEKFAGVPGAFSTQIAYVTTEWKDGKPYLYRLEIADVDGHNPKPILTSHEPIMSPSWSPDGRQLAYVSFENHRSEIYLSDIVSGKRKRVSAFPGINGAPAWSPDGKKLAVVLSKKGYPKIFSLELESGDLEQITTGWSIDTEPRWLPDGSGLLFTSNRGGGPQIYRINLADKKVKRVTFEGSYNARASITADGENIVMIHRRDSGFNIATLNLQSGQTRVLTRTMLDESPSLSPNGRMVVYGTKNKHRRVLGAVSMDGRVKLQLPASDGDVQEPAWSPFLS